LLRYSLPRLRSHACDQVTPFYWVRDYETVKIEQDVPNEFLLVLDDGDLPPTRTINDTPLERRAKGAYYKNLERKITLKKKRVNVSRFEHSCSVHPGD
jgi:RNA polymerase II-associated factor 1